MWFYLLLFILCLYTLFTMFFRIEKLLFLFAPTYVHISSYNFRVSQKIHRNKTNTIGTDMGIISHFYWKQLKLY